MTVLLHTLDLNCHENETTMDNWIQVLLLSCHITIPCHINNIGFISPPSWFWIEVSANTKPQPIPSSTVVVNSNSHAEYQLQAIIYKDENHFTCRFMYNNIWWSHNGMEIEGCCLRNSNVTNNDERWLMSMDQYIAHIYIYSQKES